MSIGVFINMNNNDCLVTVAMLSALLSKEKKDYLDIIAPFVLNLLPTQKGDKINILQILSELRQKHGFEDLPGHVLTTILKRFSKGADSIVEVKNKCFYVKNVYDSSKFDNDRHKMKSLIDDIISSLRDFLNTKSSLKNVTQKESQDRLICFLNYYGYTIVSNIDALKSITIQTDQNNYYIARFILNEYKNETVIFSKILEVIKGFLVYKAIYFFSSEHKKTFTSKLKNTEVFFDTKLLINALGYDREEDCLATRELITLIKENGGIVKTFTHNVQEVAGILTKYAKDRDSRNSLSLDFFNINNYDEVDVLRLRDLLNINIEQKCGIAIIEPPEYGTISSEDIIENKGYLDLVELKEELYKNIKYNSENAINNDIESISAISRIRGRTKPFLIEDCKAIFVTTNIAIVRTLFELYRDKFSSGEINYVISDIDLTAILWLKSFDKKSNIPCLKLMEDVYAAYCPSKEVMDAFTDKVNQLQAEGKLSPEAALVMRSHHAIKTDVLELTENDPSNISAETVKTVENKFIDRIRQRDAQRIYELEQEKEQQRERKNRAIKQAEIQAETEKNVYSKKLLLISRIVFSLVGVIGLISIIVSCLGPNSNFSIISFIGVLFGALGIIDSLVSRFGFIKKWIDRSSQNKFDKIYAKKISEISYYFD